MSGWRGYSEAQWGRLGAAVGADGARVRGRSAAASEFRRFALGAAPLVVVAACLLAPETSGTRRSSAGGVVSEEIKMKSIGWMGAMLAGSVASCAPAQNLLLNGGLEGPVGGCSQIFVPPGSGAIPGWTVSGSWNIDWNRGDGSNSCCSPFEGLYSVDLNGSPNTVSGSAIRQTVETMAGTRYELSLQAFSNPQNTPEGTVKVLRLTTGDTASDIELVTGMNPALCEGGSLPWEQIRVVFEASASEIEIELRSLFPNNAGGIIIDDVRLTELPCPGDLDNSNSVTGVDLAIVLTNWNAPNPKYPEADVNGDGAVDGADLAIVLSNWGDCT